MNSPDMTPQGQVTPSAQGTGSASGCTEAAKLWARKRTLENAIEGLAAGLPEGWTVRISIERGAAWVQVEHPDETMTPIDEADGDLYDRLRSAGIFAAFQEPNS